MRRICQWITVSTVVCLPVGCHLPGLGGSAAPDAGPDAMAFSDGAIEDAALGAAGSCPGGQVPILLQNGSPYCVMSCAKPADCPTGWTCDGDGVMDSEGEAGPAVRFCNQSGHHSVPATLTIPDAGKSVAADAGKPTLMDAGPPKLLDVKQAPPGKCPAGYGLCGAMCRLRCAKDGDCGLGTAHCQGGFCLGPSARACGK
ncbi:MAG: hypothetical protein ABTD50_16980 [Polyangiaceae bacterium]|jgi:hypothetical protein